MDQPDHRIEKTDQQIEYTYNSCLGAGLKIENYHLNVQKKGRAD